MPNGRNSSCAIETAVGGRFGKGKPFADAKSILGEILCKNDAGGLVEPPIAQRHSDIQQMALRIGKREKTADGMFGLSTS